MRRAPHDPLPGAPEPWAPSEMPPFRSRPPYLMSEMIAAEPALAQRLARRLAKDSALASLATAVGEMARARKPILVTGSGTSEHAAMGIAELLNEALDPAPGAEVRAASALEAYRRPPAAGLLVGVSHEGGTEATNAALRAAHDAGIRTALVTVSDRSPAVELADLVVRTEEQDQSWCHTVGYLSPLVAGAVLANKVAGSRTDAMAMLALLDVANDPRAVADLAAGLSGIDRLIVLGAGADFVTARELALKVAEGARLPTEALELETVLHGHLAAATRWTGLVLVLADPRADAFVRQRAARVLRAARSLALPAAALVADEVNGEIAADLTPAGRVAIPRTGRVRGVAGALLGAAIPLQLLAERLARARGVNPDTLGREDPAQAAAHG